MCVLCFSQHKHKDHIQPMQVILEQLLKQYYQIITPAEPNNIQEVTSQTECGVAIQKIITLSKELKTLSNSLLDMSDTLLKLEQKITNDLKSSSDMDALYSLISNIVFNQCTDASEMNENLRKLCECTVQQQD